MRKRCWHFRIASLLGFLLLLCAGDAWADYADGVEALKDSDYARAHAEFTLLAEQGDAAAQTKLGLIYYFGWGRDKDYTVAVRWFRAAAEQGHAEAQRMLGLAYTGSGSIALDVVAAAHWFRLAAEQDDVPAQEMLAIMYADSLGVRKSYARALYWLDRAAEQGSDFAVGERVEVLRARFRRRVELAVSLLLFGGAGIFIVARRTPHVSRRTMVIILLAPVALTAVWMLAPGDRVTLPWRAFRMVCQAGVTILLPAFLLRRAWSPRVRSWYRWVNSGRDLSSLHAALAICIYPVLPVVVWYILSLIDSRDMFDPSSAPEYQGEVYLLRPTVMFWSPLREELYYRGYLWKSLGPTLQPYVRILGIAVLFGAVHGINGAPAGLFGALLLGFWLGILRASWGLPAALVGHVFLNVMAYDINASRLEMLF